MIVTGEGQIKIGYRLQIVGKSTLDDQVAVAREAINVDGREEVIIDKARNRYFITSQLTSGQSWAKQVQILNKNCHTCEHLEYIDGECIHGSNSGYTCNKRHEDKYLQGKESEFLAQLDNEAYRYLGKVCHEPIKIK